MEKEMPNLKVTTANGNIYISQANNYLEEDTIVLHPDQAELLIQWIKEAKDDLKKL